MFTVTRGGAAPVAVVMHLTVYPFTAVGCYRFNSNRHAFGNCYQMASWQIHFNY